jgi:hypothetical protein
MKATDLDELCNFVMYQRKTTNSGTEIHLHHKKISNFYLCDVSAKEDSSFWPTLILTYRTKRNATKRKKQI